jgi:starvation-inducible DNA-binding protein
MTAYTTKIDIPAETRRAVVDLLNQHLADTFDLYSQIKQAHWNVKGLHFIALHELFDKLAADVLPLIDDIAERITTLSGVAVGTIRSAARASRLMDFPLAGVIEREALELLSDRYATLAASAREAIDTAASLGDVDTADLFTGMSRELDKTLWVLEAHLQ